MSDKIKEGDIVVLVVPIDKAAPKGRLILPQQQVIRDILDAELLLLCSEKRELEETLDRLGRKPALVITDSQVFGIVNKIVPTEIPLTSFSILMARHKGLLEAAVKGIAAIKEPERRRQGPHSGGLHTSQAVRRHRYGEDTRMDQRFYRKRD